jgi:hypothetical protein
MTFAVWRTRCGPPPAASGLARSFRRSTSKTISMPRSESGWTPLFSTAEATVPVRRRSCFVPTIPALARARRHLDARGCRDVTLVIPGGLRTHTDFAKALALGADAVAVSSSAMQAIGCIGMRACSSNNCPVGIATQKPELRARLPVELAAQRLHKFFSASAELMTVLARACHSSQRVLYRRPDDLRPRHGPSHRHRLRRRLAATRGAWRRNSSAGSQAC